MARKIIFSIIGSIFLLFAYFQLNDSDSLKWVLYYLILAGVIFGTAFRINRKAYIYLMLVVSTIWMFTLLPNAMEWVNDGMPTIVESMKASSPYIELVREFLGLFISIIVLVTLLVVERKGNIKHS